MRRTAFIFLLMACLGVTSVHAQRTPEEASAQLYALIGAYTSALFPRQDPFERVFNLEQATVLFERLLIRKQSKGDFVKSPLADVNDALKHRRARDQEMDFELINAVLDDADKVLNSSGYSLIERQSNLLALRMLGDYLRRFDVPVGVPDRDGEAVDKEKAGEKAEEKQKQKPAYQEMPKGYQPHTKDTEAGKEKGSKEDQYVIAEVNFATPFWGQRYYAEVVRGAAVPLQDIDLPMSFRSPSSASSTDKEMVVRTYGEKHVTLFLPPKVQPLQPTDPRARILRSANGGYELELSEDLEEVRIPLKAGVKEALNPLAIEVLTREVGFSDSEWPALIRQDLFDKVSPNQKQNELAVAQAVANHISGKYLYSVGARPETDPVDALKAGAFQCDMAAFLMVGVLRDVYHVPSRVVSGFRAKKHKSGKDAKSYLVMPGEAHAWVEVYHDGQWHTYDPTPIKKDKKDKKDDEEGEKDEYSDREPENTLKPEPEEEEEGAPSGEASEKEEKEKSHQERVKEDSKKREAEQKLDPKPDSKNSAADPADIMDNDELASKLEFGSLSLLSDETRNPLRDRALRVLLKLTLDPRLGGKTIFDRLTQAKSVLLGTPSAQMKSVYQEAVEVHEKNHLGLEPWLRETANLLSSRKLSDSYKELYRLKKSAELFAQTLDNNGAIEYPRALISTLDGVLSDINKLAHPDSQEIAQVQEFYQSLPGLVQQLLRQKHGLISVGPNAATKEVARLLKTGQMSDIRLLSILSPLTDFILNATPRPEFEEIKTFQRDLQKTSGQDLMPVQRFSELSKSFSSNLGRSVEENFKNGDLYVATRRHRVLIPTGFGIEEGERISIVLYDTSGSMSGDLDRFQAGLISAFTARAISDVTPGGRHRHRVVLVPFDDNPGTPVKVTNTQEALDVLRDYRSKLRNTGGGTDIQKALIQALALIADAQNQAGEPLAAANIVLMTDGQSPIDLNELAKARSAIDRSTPVQIMFAALGGTNNELMQFASESQKTGFEQGFYREYTHSLIADILREADTNPFTKVQPGFIYTDHTASSLLPITYQRMTTAQNLAREWVNGLRTLTSFTPARDHVNSIKTLKWNLTPHADRPLRGWLQELRRLGYSNVFKFNPILLETVVDDVFSNFHSLTGVQVAGLDEDELAELRHWLKYAAGMEKI